MPEPVAPPAELAVAAAVEPVAVPVVAPVEASPAPSAPLPVPAAEPVAAPVEPVAHTETPSLLETAGAEPPKPGDPAKPADTAPPAIDPAAPPAHVYEAFTMPDGITPDATKIEAFTAVLGKNAGTQEFGQELVNLHTQAMADYGVHLAAEQHRAFADTRKQWQTEIKSDERLGGASFETTSRAVARMRDMFVPEADRAGFNDFLRITGAGDHPAFWRLLANAARHFDEPSTPQPNPRPPPDIGRKNGRGSIYDHPTSAGRGQ